MQVFVNTYLHSVIHTTHVAAHKSETTDISYDISHIYLVDGYKLLVTKRNKP